MIQLYAQPYDISANGFFFETASDYAEKSKTNTNQSGDPVEEYEIQFIDGEETDCALAKAWRLNQANFAAFLDAVDDWELDDKLRYIIAVGECGYAHEDVVDDPSGMDVTIYQRTSMRELAQEFVDEGFYGNIPDRLTGYIDYNAIARDLEIDYSEITIGGTHFICHCP